MVYVWASGTCSYWAGYLVGLCVSGLAGGMKEIQVEVTHRVFVLPSRLQAFWLSVPYSLRNKAIQICPGHLPSQAIPLLGISSRPQVSSFKSQGGGKFDIGLPEI